MDPIEKKGGVYILKDFKKGMYLFLLGLGIFVGVMASMALDAGNTKLTQQILMTWIAFIGGGILFMDF